MNGLACSCQKSGRWYIIIISNTVVHIGGCSHNLWLINLLYGLLEILFYSRESDIKTLGVSSSQVIFVFGNYL